MKKILVVVDMQNDFIDGTLGTKEAVAIVPHVIDKIKAYKETGDTVYFTKDTHTKNYLETQEGKNLPVEHCIKGTKGWHLQEQISQLAEELEAQQEGEIIFEKDVFGSETLVDAIRKITEVSQELTIELVGLCTDICVLSNAILLKTCLPEVVVVVDAAGCAGVTPETHKNALQAMKMCQIHIINE